MAIVQGELYTGLATIEEFSAMRYGHFLNYYYADARSDYIILASDLTAIGFSAGCNINELRLWLSELSPQVTFNNIRIAIKHTADTTMATGSFAANGDSYSTFTEVLNAATFPNPTVTGWCPFVFGTPFTWNGTSNIKISLSRDMSGASGDLGKVTYRVPTGQTRLRYFFADNQEAFPFDGGIFGGDGAMQPAAERLPRTYLVADSGGSGGTSLAGTATIAGVGNVAANGAMSIAGSATIAGVGNVTASGVITSTSGGSATLQGVGTLAASGSIVIVRDTFTRANDATSLGTSETGHTWAPMRGVWGIDTNQAYLVSGTEGIAWQSATQSAIRVSATIKALGSFARIIVRGTVHFGVSCLLIQTNGTKYSVYKVVRDVWSLLVDYAVTPAVNDVIAVELSGSQLTFFVNGVSIGSITETFNQGEASHGIGTGDSITRFDDFKIEELPTATLAGSGTVAASGAMFIAGATTISGVGDLTAYIDVSIMGSATLSGTSTLQATASSKMLGAVTISGVGSLAKVTAISKIYLDAEFATTTAVPINLAAEWVTAIKVDGLLVPTSIALEGEL